MPALTLRIFLIILLLQSGALLSSAAESVGGKLTVAVSGIKSSAGGTLRVALFRGEKGWPKFKNAWQTREIPPTAETLKIVFSNLLYADNYAVEIHHDENGNGKFDMRWLPYPRPKEGVGVSNNSFGFGHPDFTEARFTVDSPEQQIHIQMHY